MKLPLSILPALAALLILAGCQEGGPGSRSGDPESDSTRQMVESFAASDTTLHDSLRRIESRSGGRLGIAAIHLESGWKTSYRGAETFPMASVAKLPMAIQFLRLVDSGAYRLDSVVRLLPTDYRPGPSSLYRRVRRDSGMTTLHALLESMIASSDNTASDFILRLAGGPKLSDSLMASLGLASIDISHYEGELILLWAGVDPSGCDSTWTRDRFYAKIKEAGDTAWRQAEAQLVDDPRDAASPEDAARLLALLHRRTLLAPVTTDTLLAIMSRTTTGKGRIPGMLPQGTVVAHKTGTISSTTNDIGIVTLPEGRGHLVIALFVKGSRVGVRARERAIAQAASMIYRHVMSSARGN